jgi:predicted O-methyltransferase YrrM
MGSKRHWTPTFLWNRVRVALYQRRNMDKPWLTADAIRLLGGGLLRADDVGLEWGSGRSTAWFAQRLKHLTSIEADAGWHQRVNAMLAQRGISNVDYRLCPVPDEEERESEYTRAADAFPDQSLGFVLIDGAARGTCALHALPKIQPAGILAIDNINWFLDYPTRSPQSRFGRGPRSEIWSRFEDATRGWRRIMTSTGVTDTAIWIKPGQDH